MSIETVRKIFFEKIEKQQRPEFFPFDKPGDYVIGKVVYTYQSNFGDPTRQAVEVTVLKALDPEKFKDKMYSLPNNAMLVTGLKREKVEIDDYVMVLYNGEARTRQKFPMKVFAIAKMTEEEFNNATKVSETPKTQVGPELKSQQKAKTLEKEAETPKEPKADEKTINYAVSLVKDILEFYEEMPIPQLEESLRSAGVEAPISSVIERCPFAEIEDNVIKIKR